MLQIWFVSTESFRFPTEIGIVCIFPDVGEEIDNVFLSLKCYVNELESGEQCG